MAKFSKIMKFSNFREGTSSEDVSLSKDVLVIGTYPGALAIGTMPSLCGQTHGL